MAKVDMVMPQMGESITEGTIIKWLKKEGETVGKDEIILEISTDKVDSEIPSPHSGKVSKILIPEGQTVKVGAVIAHIESTVPAKTEKTVATAAENKITESKSEKPEPAIGSIIDIVMPQMGESINEGTVIKWLKKEGERVEKDELLLEISTDKVDSEIPSPQSGVISKLLAKEGDMVKVGSVIAKLESTAILFSPR